MTIYTESFESGFGSWTSSGVTGWARLSGATPSSGTGPSGAYDGSYYVYVEMSDGTGSFVAGDEDFLTYTKVTSGAYITAVSFFYHRLGGDQGTLELQKQLPDTTWETIWSVTGDTGDQWIEVSLSALRATETIRFKNTAAGGFAADVCLDFVKVTEVVPVSDTITATLTDRAGSALASLTGLKYRWYDNAPIPVGSFPQLIAIEGTGGTTDGAGALSLAVDTVLGVDDTGMLMLENSAGSSMGMYPVKRTASGIEAGTLVLDDPRDSSSDVYFDGPVDEGGPALPVLFIIT